ncbi:Mdm33 family-domain-containing protein [Poronia punctata]|nr:Mdm33 family-domain-containing protein [Poronia punctata]
MSTPRAIKPLFGVGSRLVADQFLSRSRTAGIGIITRSTFSSSSSDTKLAAICWNCRHDYAPKRQQARFSSSSSKPPDHDGTNKPDAPNDALSPPPSSFSFPPPPTETTNNSSPTPNDPVLDPATPEKEQKPDNNTPPTPDPDLPSAQNSRRSALNQSLSAFMDRTQTALFSASQRINDLTGYSSIESLKSQISTLESQLRAAQSHLTDSRSAYKSAVSERASTQREVTTLLARQKTWTPIDFERFTTLYRQDYELEAAVGERASDLEQAERDAERLGRELGAGILARYHEEQIWSDKIRRMSTWGTWGLMGVNILLFLVLQFGAEPWRRQRLVRGFEEKVREALAEERAAREEAERQSAAAAVALRVAEETRASIKNEAEAAAAAAAAAAAVPKDIVPEQEPIEPEPTVAPVESPPASKIPWTWTWSKELLSAEYWRTTFSDIISDRLVQLRMRDISLFVLEGAVAGVVVTGSLAVFIFRR